MKTHKLAKLFPLIQGDEFDALVFSVKVNGLLEPITTLNRSILDGRNRYAACIKAGVEPHYIPFKGGDPLAFVLAKNLDRRHLNESQRAMVAARLVTTTHGGNRRKGPIDPLKVEDAAEKLNVGERTVKRANAVRNEGVDELVAAVEQGDIPVSVAAKIARENADDQLAILAADDPKTEIKRRKRAAKLRSIEGKAGSMPDRESAVIYADPPWSWDMYSEAGKDRTPENHYQLMELDDICALEIPATDDAVLFMWTTTPHLENALAVLRAWGFKYKSNIMWVKDRIGMGYWARNKHEHLLVATLGNFPAPERGTQCASVIEAAVGAHSVKPEDFRAIIDGYYPGVRKLEMFARGELPDGWDGWGNEAG